MNNWIIDDNEFDNATEAAIYIMEHCAEYYYDDYLDEIYGEVIVGCLTFLPSRVLYECDPTAYECGRSDWESDESESIEDELASMGAGDTITVYGFDVALVDGDPDAVLDAAQFRGNVEGITALLDEIKTMKWFDSHGVLPEGCLLFETREEALDAADDVIGGLSGRRATRDAVCKAALEAACDDVWNAAYAAAHNAARYAEWDVAEDAADDAADDAALYASVLTCDSLTLDRKHVDHAKLIWSVWQNGYGVACDVNGEVYCYEEP